MCAKQMCETCIFHPGNLMRLNRGRVKGMITRCLKVDGTIPCHERKRAKDAICRGFFDLHWRDIAPLRLAVALDKIVEDE